MSDIKEMLRNPLSLIGMDEQNEIADHIEAQERRIAELKVIVADHNRTAEGFKSENAVANERIAELEAQAKPMHEQNARFAIDGAIAYGMQGTNRPPESDHWLMEYWQIGQMIAAQAGPVFFYRDNKPDQSWVSADKEAWDRLKESDVHRGWYEFCIFYSAPPAPANALTDDQIKAGCFAFDPVLKFEGEKAAVKAFRLAIGQTAPANAIDAEGGLLDIVRTLVCMADRMALPNSENYPSPLSNFSPLIIAARKACVDHGFTAGGLTIAAMKAAK